MSIKERVFKKESLDRYLAEDGKFNKTLSAKDLISMGIGAVIGTGIFILPGTVAALHSGPAITISFVIAALVCSTAAMCYAEFSSALPIAGSAYSFGNVVFGEIVGWFLGWALILEYMLSVAAVSTGFSAYFNSLLAGFGIHLPKAITGPFDPTNGTFINLPAVLIVLFIAYVLSRGLRTSMTINSIVVVIKIAIIILFLLVGMFYVKPANWDPFMPFGIIGTLAICTLLYILVSIVLTGMISYTKLNVADPVSFALYAVKQNWVAGIISVSALAGMFTMMVTMVYSSSRLIYSIGRDGLLPKFLGQINEKTKTPEKSMLIVTVIGGFFSLNQLTNLVNIGTLLAFMFVSLGVLPLRKRKDIPNKDGFKVPFYPVLPIISAILCAVMLAQLSLETWTAAFVWFAVGMVIYFSYGIKHSKINE